MAVVKLDELLVTPAATDNVELAPPAMRTYAIESEVELAMERESMKFGNECRAKGYRMYMAGKDPAAISKALDIPGLTTDTVLAWARDGEWALRLRKKNDLRERLVRENIRGKRLAHAELEVESSLRISNKIRTKAETLLDNEGLTPMGLKNIADAAKASGDLGAHGMGDSGPSDTEQQAKGGKVPLVMIFPSGGLPPPPETMKPVIEVKDNGD